MPELPEVETTLRGVAPHIVDQFIDQIRIHNGSLRWPVTQGISELAKRSASGGNHSPSQIPASASLSAAP